MARSLRSILRLAVLAAAMAAPATAQQKFSEKLLSLIPPELRTSFEQFVTPSARTNDNLLSEHEYGQEVGNPERFRRAVFLEIMRSKAPGAAEFALRQMVRESDYVRRTAVAVMIGDARWMSDPRFSEFIFDRIANDPDSNVVKVSVEALRALSMRLVPNVAEAIAARAAKEQQAGNRGMVDVVGRLEERWQKVRYGVAIPSDMQVPPPHFEVKTRQPAIRVLAFGDFGGWRPTQGRVASAMRMHHQQTPFDLGITLGDNFYPSGMESIRDPRWKTEWEDLYGPLGIRFYAALGNHDFDSGNADGVPAEIMYSQISQTWYMPATHYTYTAGPVQFFALNTNTPFTLQMRWLREELEKSKARWKVVYGHHPIYVANQAPYDTLKAGAHVASVLDVVRDRADVYIAGHHHSMQHVKMPNERVHHVIAGGGGAKSYGVSERAMPEVLFAKSDYGFAVLEADDRRIVIRFVDAKGIELYRAEIR